MARSLDHLHRSVRAKPFCGSIRTSLRHSIQAITLPSLWGVVEGFSDGLHPWELIPPSPIGLNVADLVDPTDLNLDTPSCRAVRLLLLDIGSPSRPSRLPALFTDITWLPPATIPVGWQITISTNQVYLLPVLFLVSLPHRCFRVMTCRLHPST